jgi:hypothetical protein
LTQADAKQWIQLTTRTVKSPGHRAVSARIESAGIALAALFLTLTVTRDVTAQQYRWITILNESNDTIVTLFISTSDGRGDWVDWLEKEVLRPGQRHNVNLGDLSGACIVDVRADFGSHRSWELHNFNICTQSALTIR